MSYTIDTVKERHDEKGLVFNIQRFSLHDGPGIRTLVFLKGCPLRCAWCANPEGLTRKNQVLYHKAKCRNCGACLQCPSGAISVADGQYCTDQPRCTGCGACEKLCVYGARTMTNQYMSAQEVIDICLRDSMFYKNSQGGITLGGGDPMGQPAFAQEILYLAKENGLNSSIETSAYADKETFFSIIKFCNTVHVDIKSVDPVIHKKITGVSSDTILRNIKAYDDRNENNGKIIFRIPLVPGYNAEIKNIESIGAFIASLKGTYAVELLPFHNFGGSKYEQLCYPYALKDADNMKKSEAVPYADALSAMGLSVTINTH